ncbi:hypothetical protein DLAC_07856 [Tieghemostelium lacteum]|uniref:Uncharacterized protein n=1 Tax=Tieghemostelium lacteum TaxID=361077 RepID=A0A151ZAJ6_TIELA|nr:hypothetical protein DLAC_07856 [Tieghemostelium lacteum]|eukprot:KYQ90969.1 hypothetical protein DLAC_07856 [Tieghemostelium lacteum]
MLTFNNTIGTQEKQVEEVCLINPEDFYGEISPRAIKEEGIHNLQSPLTLFRQEVCIKVAKHLNTNNFTLIRSPSFTGKTSFGQIFHEYLKKTKQNVYIRRVALIWLDYNREENFESSWKFYTGRTFSDWFEFAESNDVLFILDNVQMFYNSSLAIYDLFWKKIKSASHRMSFLMLAGYGEKPGTQHSTPITLPYYEDPQILFLKISEYHELYTRSCPIIIDSSLSKEELEILDHVIEYKNFEASPIREKNSPLSKLIKRGYLIKIGNTDVYKIPSPWYYKIYVFQIKTKIYKPFLGRLPENKEGISKLLVEALKRFRLFRAAHTLSVGENNSILEVFWHNELYISLANYFILPFISSHVGKYFGSSGDFDIYINDLHWAIDILHNGIQIEENMLKFLHTGVYGAYLPIKQRVVLDFRLSTGNIPLQEQILENYIIIVASVDYEYFTLYSKEFYQLRVIANGKNLEDSYNNNKIE